MCTEDNLIKTDVTIIGGRVIGF